MEKEKTMRSSRKWYERAQMPYAEDLRKIKGYANWFRQVKWCLFCTFTFAWKVSDQQANEKFDEFINRLERLLNCDVGYVRGDEKRHSGCGKPESGRHFHALLIFTATVHPEFVEELWERHAGRRKNGAGALVKPFDPHGGPDHTGDGIAYVIKYVDQPEGDWKFNKLHLFPPFSKDLKDNKRMRRHIRRHPALLQLRESQVHGA